MNKIEQESAVKSINRNYLEELILREMKICLVKENYSVGIYTFDDDQVRGMFLGVIKDVYSERIFGEPFRGTPNIDENDIIIDFNNGSTIKILNYHYEKRSNRFNDVLINSLIPQKDIDEIIKPRVIIQKSINNQIFYYEM